jgi:phosphatidylglycerol:prolipoprotein diacylglycerol transferase
MYPVVEIGPLTVRSYTITFALGFLTALAIILRAARAEGLRPIRLFELCLCSICVGIFGARLLDAAAHYEHYLAHPLDVFQMDQGMAFLGGPLLVVPFVAVYVRWARLPLAKTYDLLALGLVPGLAIARVGCFLNGCCHGRATACPLGVCFPYTTTPALRDVPVHPTQLYEAAAVLLLSVVLFVVWRRRAFDGQIVLLFFLGYAVLRGLIEIVRGDTERGFFLADELSTSQCVSIIAFIVALPIYLILWNQARAVRRAAVPVLAESQP